MDVTQLAAQMNTSPRRVILLDFDGVLHRGDVYRTPNGIVPLRVNVDLFEFAHLFAESIEPYPRVELPLGLAMTLFLETSHESEKRRDSLAP